MLVISKAAKEIIIRVEQKAIKRKTVVFVKQTARVGTADQKDKEWRD